MNAIAKPFRIDANVKIAFALIRQAVAGRTVILVAGVAIITIEFSVTHPDRGNAQLRLTTLELAVTARMQTRRLGLRLTKRWRLIRAIGAIEATVAFGIQRDAAGTVGAGELNRPDASGGS